MDFLIYPDDARPQAEIVAMDGVTRVRRAGPMICVETDEQITGTITDEADEPKYANWAAPHGGKQPYHGKAGLVIQVQRTTWNGFAAIVDMGDQVPGYNNRPQAHTAPQYWLNPGYLRVAFDADMNAMLRRFEK